MLEICEIMYNPHAISFASGQPNTSYIWGWTYVNSLMQILIVLDKIELCSIIAINWSIN